jgi:hypothetical protein
VLAADPEVEANDIFKYQTLELTYVRAVSRFLFAKIHTAETVFALWQ